MLPPEKRSPSSSSDPTPLLNNNALAEKNLTELQDITPSTFDEQLKYYSVDDAISKIGNGKFQYRLMFLTGGIWAADAMEMMLLSFVMPILKDEWSLASPLDGAISAVVFAGMLCGTAFWSILADKIGRKKVVIISTLGCAIFGALSGLAPEIYLMLTARFLVGFSVGGSGTAYTLFAEYAPQEVRGSMLVIEQSFWSIGAIFSVLLAWLCLMELTWRWYMIFSSIPLFMISLFSKWMPESSRWLLACGRVKEAEEILQNVAEINGGHLPQGHLQPVKTSSRGNPLDAFKPKYRKTSILLYIAFFMCVFGYYGICFISVKFFQDVQGGDIEAGGGAPDEDLILFAIQTSPPPSDAPGWKSSKTYWESLIAASSELPALFIGVYVLDKIGRKKTLWISFGVFGISSFLLMIPMIQHSTTLGVTCVFIARMMIALGFMAIYIYFSEYYPTAIRSTALGMASAAGRIAGMSTSIVSEDTPFTIGIFLYGMSGVIACVCTLFIGETMGKVMTTSVVEAPQPQWLINNIREAVDIPDENYGDNVELQNSSPKKIVTDGDIDEENYEEMTDQ